MGNDKGRLTQEDIDRMVAEAEKFKAEDDKEQAKQTARQEIKSYCDQICDALENDTMIKRLKADEAELLEQTIADCMEWLEKNEGLDVELLEEKKLAAEKVVKPLMLKMYAAQAKENANMKGKKKSRR